MVRRMMRLATVVSSATMKTIPRSTRMVARVSSTRTPNRRPSNSPHLKLISIRSSSSAAIATSAQRGSQWLSVASTASMSATYTSSNTHNSSVTAIRTHLFIVVAAAQSAGTPGVVLVRRGLASQIFLGLAENAHAIPDLRVDQQPQAIAVISTLGRMFVHEFGDRVSLQDAIVHQLRLPQADAIQAGVLGL